MHCMSYSQFCLAQLSERPALEHRCLAEPADEPCQIQFAGTGLQAERYCVLDPALGLRAAGALQEESTPHQNRCLRGPGQRDAMRRAPTGAAMCSPSKYRTCRPNAASADLSPYLRASSAYAVAVSAANCPGLAELAPTNAATRWRASNRRGSDPSGRPKLRRWPSTARYEAYSTLGPLA